MSKGSISAPLDLAVWVSGLLDVCEIPHVLGGSLASSIFGEPRSTNDIDFAAQFTPETLEAFVSKIDNDFYVNEATARQALRSLSSFNLIHHESVQKVDFFILGNRPFDLSQLSRRRRIKLSGSQSLWISSGEDIILNKLLWYRKTGLTSDRQWKDVLSVLRIQKGHLDMKYLLDWSQQLGVNELLKKVRAEE